jgi:hypothetical protein
MTLRKRLLLAALAVAVVAVVGTVIAAPYVPAVFEDVVADNHSHRWRCADLPTRADLQAMLDRNADLVRTIRSLDPRLNSVWFEINEAAGCPGRSDLLLTYDSHRLRNELERLVRGTEFENAPINWRNT